ncbi:MAG: hypothetical protein AAGI07_20550 [Bacteroidota bacterium]
MNDSKIIKYLPWYNILGGLAGMLLVIYNVFVTNASQNLYQLLFFLFYLFIFSSGIKFKNDKSKKFYFILSQILQILSFSIHNVIDYFFCAGFFIGVKIEGLKISFSLELMKVHFRVVLENDTPSSIIVNIIPILIVVYLSRKVKIPTRM